MQIKPGDIALVTGASQGLGVHIARALAQRGVHLVLAARSAAALEQVAATLRTAANAEVITVPTDVADPAALERLIAAATERFGRVDILVNNAGLERTLAYDELPIADITQMIAVNLTGPMLLTRLLLPQMLRNGRGHIVNIASVAGVMASPYEEPYVATKHGLVGFTRSLRLTAQELKWPVSASVICPGFMDGAGMYEEMKKDHGVRAPLVVGSMHAALLGDAVIHAIESDQPDVILMKGAPRLFVALLALLPRAFEYFSHKLDTASVFRVVAKARRTNGGKV
jgi:short-subunit dehydrogenase